MRGTLGLGKVARYYEAPVPPWLRIGVLLVAMMLMASDVTTVLHLRAWSGSTAWVLAELVLGYAAVGLGLLAAPMSLLLVWASMLVAFSTGLTTLAAIAACVVALIVVAACRVRLSAIHCLASLVWGAAAAWTQSGAALSFFTNMVFGLGLAVLLGVGVRYLVLRYSTSQAHIAELETRQANIRREEREDLARELHDVVAHHITVITMQVMGGRRSKDPQELRQILQIVDGAAREALGELRVLLELLREHSHSLPTVTNQNAVDVPLPDVVQSHVEALAGLGFQVAEARIDPRVSALPQSLRNTCNRIVQESVTNIIKHARHGAVCSISVSLTATEAVVRVTNDRPKAASNDRQGFGLIGIRERVAAVGGSCTTQMRGDQWEVEAHIPLHGERPGEQTTGLLTPALDLSALEAESIYERDQS